MLINRLDSLCTLVLTGQWPSGRRYVSEAQLNPSSELAGDEMAYTRVIRKSGIMPGGPGAEGDDGEFTVKLLKVRVVLLLFADRKSDAGSIEIIFMQCLKSKTETVLWSCDVCLIAKLHSCLSSRQEEGLKLTFSKQALMPNGSAGESSRKKRKDQEVRV